MTTPLDSFLPDLTPIRRDAAPHTPGPWIPESYTPKISAGRQIIAHPSGKVVAHALPVEEREANARLIASAPELLSTLKSLAEFVDRLRLSGEGFPLGGTPAELTEARAAIAKATGETP